MDCSEFQSMLDSYAELDDIKRAQMDEHCIVCEKCREELEFYKSVINAVSTLPKMEAPKSLLDDINARIDKEEKKQNVFTLLGKHSYRYGAVAACVALVAIVGVKNSGLVDRLINKDYGVVMETTQTVASTEAPQATQAVSPEPVVTAAPTSEPTAEPKSTKKPVKVTPKPTVKPQKKTTVKTVTAPVVTIAPTAVPTPAPTAEPTAVPVVTDAPAMETPAYTIQERGYRLPQEGEETAYSVNENNEDYSISTASEEWAVVSTTLTISSEDEERVRELIDIYTSDFDGASYTIDPERMEYMLDVFTQEGIEYNDSAMEATKGADKSMVFTLIVA